MAGYPSLYGRAVVITGASSGIGRAAAHAFARAGCRLVLAARNEGALDETARECRDLGGEAELVVCDVGTQRDVGRLAETALTRYGRLDVWVNDAAIIAYGRIEQVPPEEFEKVIHVNLIGTANGCRAAIPIFRTQGFGVLINLASVAGTVGLPESSAYVASKWAIRGLSESLRQEVRDQRDIAICTVLPPSVDTPLFQHAANHSGRQVRPVPPIIRPEQVADVIVALARKPRREASVGAMAPLLRAGHAVAPGLTERMMARNVEANQFSDQPAADSSGNLFSPGADAVHGGWNGAHSSTRTAIAWAAGAAIAVPLGVYAWRRMREANQRSAYL